MLVEYEKAYNKLLLQSIVKGVYLNKPPFGTVYSRFSNICFSLLNIIGKPYWDHKDSMFKENIL